MINPRLIQILRLKTVPSSEQLELAIKPRTWLVFHVYIIRMNQDPEFAKQKPAGSIDLEQFLRWHR